MDKWTACQASGVRSIDKKDKNSYIYYIPPPWGVGITNIMKNEIALNRIKTIEGHLRGIHTMLEEGAYCIDVIRQIQAVQSALNKVSGLVLEQHLNSCVITAVRGEDLSERERVLKEIQEVFSQRKNL